MKPKSTSFLIGLFLILIGALFLLHTTGLFWLDEEITVSIVFFSAGLVFLIAYFFFKKPVWALIFGGIGVFIGSAIFINESRILPDEAIGIILFILAGLIFLTGLRQGKKNWWVLIPGGFCFVLAAHILIDMSWHIPNSYHSVVFFGGLGLIFGIIYLLRDKNYDLGWAKYPSIILFIVAGISLLAVDVRDWFSRLVFPLILIGAGSLILFKSLKPKETEDSGKKMEKPKKTPRSTQEEKTELDP
jgi:hypothetical protein